MNFSDYITHIDNKEDLPYLRSRLLDVNIRLFKSSRPYRKLIQRACNYIEFLCKTTMDGYSKPFGMSGANAGIPWNIIAYQVDRNKPHERTRVLINPEITHYSDIKSVALSNCGSIRLTESIEVERSDFIWLKYYDLDGIECHSSFDRKTGSFTIQHEVDHNKGILITDRKIKTTNESKKNLCSREIF